eukprot:COSAG02_NODE_5736_length_4079_cov_3.219598_4_plen_122_part_00
MLLGEQVGEGGVARVQLRLSAPQRAALLQACRRAIQGNTRCCATRVDDGIARCLRGVPIRRSLAAGQLSSSALLVVALYRGVSNAAVSHSSLVLRQSVVATLQLSIALGKCANVLLQQARG